MNIKSDWPWTSIVDPVVYDTNKDWPKISIVTPSYNQGQFIEETILSVLNQNYPNLQYIIIDGGSTDDTVGIIKEYEHRINYWVSEKDSGQVEAIKKGIKKCTGNIFNWVNSDDLLAENALFEIAVSFLKNREVSVIAGGCSHFTTKISDSQQYFVNDLTFEGLITETSWFQQPAQWITESVFKNLYLNENLNYAFDWEMILRMNLEKIDIHYLSNNLAYFRIHPQSKTSLFDLRFKDEKLSIVKSYLKTRIPLKKKILLFLYSFRLKNYLTTKKHQDASNKNNIFDLLSFGVKHPQVFLSRYYVGQIRKSLCQEK
ncbi:MAG: glycosyltransferase family 2 protein [Sphingobacteriaceae bacterium]